MRNIREVVNALLRRPWYTASILTVIGVGFALLSSVLAVVDGVLFKPLGYPGESQLVAIRVSSSRSRTTPRVRPEDLAAWASVAPGVAFTGFGVWGTGDSQTGRALVLSNFFDVIGVRPALGGFVPEDFQAPRPLIEPNIVTFEVFQTQFGGDPAAIGRTVIDNPSTGAGYRIVGVMPRGFVFPWDRLRVGYIGPFVAVFPFNTVNNFVVARMPPSMAPVNLRQRVLAAAAATSNASNAPTTPDNPVIDQADVQPLGRMLGAGSRPLFTALLAAASLLLIIAALNAVSLMAARSVDRERELAVRRALGAGPGAIGRLLLTEVAVLLGVGALIGLTLAVLVLRIIVPLLPDDLVLFRAAAIDTRVTALTVVVAIAVAAAAMMALLRRAIAGDTSLQSGRTVTESARSVRRRLVITVQVALALVLTVGGSLLVGSLLSVYGQQEPITTKGVITIRTNFLDIGPISDLRQRVVRVEALLERLRHIPGVDAAAVTAADFLNGGHTPPRFVQPATASAARVIVEAQAVSADYYQVIEPQVVAGRLPTARELANDEPVIVIGERVASHYWPNTSAIGQTLTDQVQPGLTFTVVGIVKDVRWFSWDATPVPTIYSPFALRARFPQPTFLIRTSADPTRVTSDVLRVMAETDAMLRPQRPALLDELFVDTVRPRRLQAWLFGSFAAASLFVVAIGILGQLAMVTARRTREVGIRMACGATRTRIVRLIVSEQLVPVVAGLAAGGIGAAWAVGVLGSYLYQLTSSDARVWAAAIGLILFAAVAGTLMPALRASRIDPAQALRAQ
jgi:putative ABC transport system permease protein